MNNSILITAQDQKARTGLSQYIARHPVSLNKIIYIPEKAQVLYKTKYNDYFGENIQLFTATDFIITLTLPLLIFLLIIFTGRAAAANRQFVLDLLFQYSPDGSYIVNTYRNSVENPTDFVGASNLPAYYTALVLLGLGWNFLFIGATVMLTQTYSPGERFRAQALNDLTVFGVQASASLSAGAVLQLVSWDAVNLIGVAVLVIALGLLVRGRKLMRLAIRA